MTNNGGRRAARRIAAGLSVMAAGGLILPAGVAHADPTQEEVEQTLEDLNEEVGSIVEEYNQAKEEYDTVKKKADELDKQVGDEEERYEELRDSVAAFASAAYRSNNLESTSSLLTVENPEDILDHSADIGYLSENQQSQLDEFEGSSERLIKLKQENDELLVEAKKQKDELEEKKEEVEAKIAEQEELLEQFPDADPSPSGSADGSGAVGGSYTGSASGSAASALDFAYAQIGKPYVYGSAGPGSFDCSGLIMRAWGAAGVSLPRTTYGQAEAGQRVSYDAMQPGDMIFFYGGLTHAGLYAGNGQMVHAPRTGKNVEVVPLAGYWDGQFQFAVRP
ncbi:NlpC/P60 family protein [Nocardiopsis ansamitocini]|uniref:NlpC/P60 domain-containing protein n=1 Tax=Nocardiopsis ansamitocini TaxID=1670832 RepID=A0A9W6P2L0_9ACTN|nr:C40 family peptidase [Nocardiopsis ansamitocini]GLU46080.1 hypothetical protein Nans01_04310 [Nocardiopsis ansamitocini]